MPATIVDIYCRVAPNDSDSRTGLRQQEADCRAYCEQHGLIVSLVHTDIATGMSYRDREQLTNLRCRYRAGHIQGVVITTLDCLGHSPAHLVILLQEMIERDVKLYCVHENVEDTTVGDFVMFVIQTIADIEQERALDTLLTE